MTEKLETKRLRGLTAAGLADEVGAHKATIAAVEERIDALKAEGVRRQLTEFDSALFHCTLSPPGSSRRFDKELLGTVMGAAFVDHFSKDVAGTSWTLRCFSR